MTSTIRVAVIQSEVASTLSQGIEKTASLTADAARNGATLVAFPETWLPGYPIWLDVTRDTALWDHAPVKQVYRRMAEQSVVVPSETTERLSSIARDNAVTLVIGVVERIAQGAGQ